MYLGVVATIDAKPAHLARVLAVLAPSRSESTSFTGSWKTRTVWLMVERWQSVAALDRHLQTPHFKQWQQRLDGAIDGLSIVRLAPIQE